MPYQDTVDAPPAQSRVKAGWIYPLVNADRYWEEDDADQYDISPDKKYSYAMIPGSYDGGDYHCMDMWITDELGNVHPGYDACPVPILLEDIRLDQGRAAPRGHR